MVLIFIYCSMVPSIPWFLYIPASCSMVPSLLFQGSMDSIYCSNVPTVSWFQAFHGSYCSKSSMGPTVPSVPWFLLFHGSYCSMIPRVRFQAFQGSYRLFHGSYCSNFKIPILFQGSYRLFHCSMIPCKRSMVPTVPRLLQSVSWFP